MALNRRQVNETRTELGNFYVCEGSGFKVLQWIGCTRGGSAKGFAVTGSSAKMVDGQKFIDELWKQDPGIQEFEGLDEAYSYYKERAGKVRLANGVMMFTVGAENGNPIVLAANFERNLRDIARDLKIRFNRH